MAQFGGVRWFSTGASVWPHRSAAPSRHGQAVLFRAPETLYNSLLAEKVDFANFT